MSKHGLVGGNTLKRKRKKAARDDVFMLEIIKRAKFDAVALKKENVPIKYSIFFFIFVFKGKHSKRYPFLKPKTTAYIKVRK